MNVSTTQPGGRQTLIREFYSTAQPPTPPQQPLAGFTQHWLDSSLSLDMHTLSMKEHDLFHSIKHFPVPTSEIIDACEMY